MSNNVSGGGHVNSVAILTPLPSTLRVLDRAPGLCTRREFGWAVLGCALAVTLFLGPALFTGRYLSPADLLYRYLPWGTQPPAPSTWPHAENGGLYDNIAVFSPWLHYTAQQ